MHSEGSTEPSWAMNRRDFFRLGGVGIAGTVLLGVMGSGDVLGQSRPGSSLAAEFEEAAAEYEVPKELLLAMGYVNTRWEMPPPETSAFEEGEAEGKGTYGIMQLVRNPTADTLGEAARLTGIPEEQLKTDRRSNIMGGAALLATSQGKKPNIFGDWLGAVSGKGGQGKFYRAVAGIGGGELYADQVFQTLVDGASARIKTGEVVTLAPQDPQARVTVLGRVLPKGLPRRVLGSSF